MSIAFITSSMLTKVMSWSTPGGRENQRRETTALPPPPRGGVCWSPRADPVAQETSPAALASRGAIRGASGSAHSLLLVVASVPPIFSGGHLLAQIAALTMSRPLLRPLLALYNCLGDLSKNISWLVHALAAPFFIRTEVVETPPLNATFKTRKMYIKWQPNFMRTRGYWLTRYHRNPYNEINSHWLVSGASI